MSVLELMSTTASNLNNNTIPKDCLLVAAQVPCQSLRVVRMYPQEKEA